MPRYESPHEDPNNPLFHWGGGGQPQDVNLEAIVNKVVPRDKLMAAAEELAETEDGTEGGRAFTEKRRPVWKLR